MYAFLYLVHTGCVVISISGFILRALLKMQDHPIMQQKLPRILPHLVDSLLLVSAICLSLLTREYPLADSWLSAKLAALFVYILFGIVCLRTRSSRLRLISFLAATATFAYMVSVALTRSPLGHLAAL